MLLKILLLKAFDKSNHKTKRKATQDVMDLFGYRNKLKPRAKRFNVAPNSFQCLNAYLENYNL